MFIKELPTGLFYADCGAKKVMETMYVNEISPVEKSRKESDQQLSNATHEQIYLLT